MNPPDRVMNGSSHQENKSIELINSISAMEIMWWFPFMAFSRKSVNKRRVTFSTYGLNSYKNISHKNKIIKDKMGRFEATKRLG